MDSYCVCKALSLSKPRFRNWTELPLFLSLLEREAFESWKALLCYLLSFKLDVACVSLGDVRVFSSATALCGFACCFYKCKLISGGSVASLAEATMDSLLAFVNSASLELVAAVSFCLSSRFWAKAGANVAFSLLCSKLFKLGLRLQFASGSSERATKAGFGLAYFGAVCLLR
ncbi:MAG: hypothetical protein P3M72_00150 [Candidatus Hodgkinia cicadicola]|nr:MAG: hypothetical protein P3M72_00150 [Candidatus Hodgkinia cicadicola]